MATGGRAQAGASKDMEVPLGRKVSPSRVRMHMHGKSSYKD